MTNPKILNTLKVIFDYSDLLDVYLIGGLSIPLQANIQPFRENNDIDLMCNAKDLEILLQRLKTYGYDIDDRRGEKTRNRINSNGEFIPMDHEINANTKNKNMLSIGIFVFYEENNHIILNSFAYDERIKNTVCTEKHISKELFSLIYENSPILFFDMKIKTQSKEYLFIKKQKGSREKDKQDLDILSKILDKNSDCKILQIKYLSSKIECYQIISPKQKIKIKSFKEKVFEYLSLHKTDIKNLYKTEEYLKTKKIHPEIDLLINDWKNQLSG